MGPGREPNEQLSTFRFRCAGYWLLWALGLGVLTFLFFGLRSNGVISLLEMFVLVGLPMGTAMASVATVGFLIGGFFSRYAESSERAGKVAERIKITLIGIATASIAICFEVVAVRGVMSQSIPVFSRRSHAVVRWDTEPVMFGVTVALWIGMGLWLLWFMGRKLKNVYSP